MADPRTRNRRLLLGGALAIGVLCLLYVPMAATATLPYLHPGAGNIETWLRGFLPTGSVAAQSISDAVADRMAPYTHSLIPIVVHTVTGAAIMVLGPFQLFTGITGRFGRHRITGMVYLAAVIVSMGAAFTYLIRTPWTEVFDGPVFAVGLWVFGLGTVAATILGVLAIRARSPQRHLRWMIFGFAFLLSAPLLRLGWTSIMALSPSVGLPMANLYVSSLIFPVCTMLAFVLARLAQRRTSRSGPGADWVPRRVLPVCAAVGALGYGALGLISFTWDSEWAPTQLWFSAGYLGATAVCCYLMMAAMASRAHSAEQHWRLALAAQVVAPAVGLLIAAGLMVITGLDDRQAVMAGVGVAPGVTSFVAFLRADRMLRRADARALPPVRVESRATAESSPSVG